MVPEVGFTDIFTPVVADELLTKQIAIDLKKYRIGWKTHSCDIEASFLEPLMDKPMYILPHPALVVCLFMTDAQRKELTVLLKKSIYRNIDVAIFFCLKCLQNI